MRTRSLRTALAALLLAAPAGCGYSVRAPFDQQVKTVFVPTFRSISFRRDLNLMLTEMVVKEIERRTPYKVVGTREGADTILDGTIILADKNIMVENPYNLPRQMTAQINTSVNWTHNPPLDEELERGPTTIGETVNFVPEVGETAEVAFSHAAQLIARQIVDMMEKPW